MSVSFLSRTAGVLVVAILASSAIGCQAGYLIEQGVGQIGLTWRRVPLDDPDLLASLDAEERRKLEWIPRILEFARSELDLDPGDSYTTYLDTAGEPISHIVVASHPLALIAYEWCFPIVGCVPYRGHFDLEDAETLAAELREEGWEVEIRPVDAYSTLGWFSDPVLSGMLDRSLAGLVDLLIHETLHHTLYIPGSTDLNESLATHVAHEGTRRFFAAHSELADEHEMKALQRSQRSERLYTEVLARLRDDLDTLFRGSLSDDEKRRRKTELMATAKASLDALYGKADATDAETDAESGDEQGGFRAPNNAFVLSVDRYHGYLPALRRLQAESGGDLEGLMTLLREAYARDPGSLERMLSRKPGP
jgi:predicted aminopeptidase